ncbi:MAG: hypothetical protein ABIF82_05350 [Planctomycetota bacterium]
MKPPHTTARFSALLALLALAALAAGCRTTSPPPVTLGLGTDPCADRLHDICGELLIYYAVHKELPERLADLDKKGTGPTAALVCPTSGKPYAYDRTGLQVRGWPGKLIMYDAEPCHSGTRWGILAEPPRPGEPLVVRVVRPPETAFSAPTRRPENQPR